MAQQETSRSRSSISILMIKDYRSLNEMRSSQRRGSVLRKAQVFIEAEVLEERHKMNAAS